MTERTTSVCPKCGSPQVGNEIFCSSCGRRIVRAPSAIGTAPGRRDRRFERGFYLTFTFAFLVLVAWTFARTFYLRPLYRLPPLSALLHVHGVVMTGWVVLLAVQSLLIGARRISWHRRLGVFGAVWAALVVIFGTTTTIHAAAREVRGHTRFARGQIVITSLDLVQMVLFAGLVFLAIRLRRRTDWHKRLMLLTIACMLPDALARLPVSFMTNRLILWGLDGFVLLGVGIDTLGNRRLHPALAWGALIVLGPFHAGLHWFRAPGWIAFASRWLS
ncbi:MAG TPA: zinc ribbon domain-containing protein [Thermoanaerobaculia bacterium]|nr:zinc ribbon domain-containing protein [Thermoanaerobaculia bacterium]